MWDNKDDISGSAALNLILRQCNCNAESMEYSFNRCKFNSDRGSLTNVQNASSGFNNA